PPSNEREETTRGKEEEMSSSHLDDVFGESYACIEQGLCYDDVGQKVEAVSMYERGLILLHEGEQMEGAKDNELYQYIKAAEGSARQRMAVLQREIGQSVRTGTSELSKAKEAEFKGYPSLPSSPFGEEEAEMVLCIPEGVQLFSIDDNWTNAPTYPSPLSMFKFPPRQPAPPTSSTAPPSFDSLRPDAIIQVGPWTYPLFKGQTPVLVNEFGAYVVSNPTPDNADLSVAILLPADLDDNIKKELNGLLRELAVLRESSEAEGTKERLSSEEKKRVSERIARFLMKSSEKVAWTVQKTSVRTASLVHQKSEKWRSAPPTDKPMLVSPTVKSGVVYVHKGSKVVAKCTRYLLDKIGDVGVSVGRKVANGAKSTFGDGKGGGVVAGTITVLGGGIAGVSTVWIALEDASKTLCRSIADDTVGVVKVKYGDDAASTTHHTLYAAGHGTLAAAQLWDLGPRSIAGRMARKAGIQWYAISIHRRNTRRNLWKMKMRERRNSDFPSL
ncbi:spg-20, partial [Pristionchus pacificus]